MQNEAVPLQWAPVIGVTAAIVSIIVGAAVAYLRLFINNSLNAHEKALMEHIDEKFALKELMIEKFDSLERNLNVRFAAIEGRIEALERRT